LIVGRSDKCMKAASCVMRRPRTWMPVSAGAFALAALLVPLAAATPAFAARLGGAYNVDDAEIGKSGSCEFETWGSFAANRDHIAVFSPACVVNLGGPVELGTNLVNQRSDGEPDSFVSLTAKAVPIPIGPSGFGLAVAGAIVYDPLDRTGSGAILNIPVTYDFSNQLRFNVNFGFQFNTDDSLQPNQGHRLGRHLRPQPHRRRCQLDHLGADHPHRRQLIRQS
jgi:hypothetical protein